MSSNRLRSHISRCDTNMSYFPDATNKTYLKTFEFKSNFICNIFYPMVLLFSNGGGEINTEVIYRHVYCLDYIVEHGVHGSEPIRRGSQEGTGGGGQRVSRAA